MFIELTNTFASPLAFPFSSGVPFVVKLTMTFAVATGTGGVASNTLTSISAFAVFPQQSLAVYVNTLTPCGAPNTIQKSLEFADVLGANNVVPAGPLTV